MNKMNELAQRASVEALLRIVGTQFGDQDPFTFDNSKRAAASISIASSSHLSQNKSFHSCVSSSIEYVPVLWLHLRSSYLFLMAHLSRECCVTKP
jgi:hypothetical protein